MLKKLVLSTGLIAALANHSAYASDQQRYFRKVYVPTQINGRQWMMAVLIDAKFGTVEIPFRIPEDNPHWREQLEELLARMQHQSNHK